MERVTCLATFSRRVSLHLWHAYCTGIVIRALWTIFDCVCYIAACAANRTCISPVNQKSRFLVYEGKERTPNKYTILPENYFSLKKVLITKANTVK